MKNFFFFMIGLTAVGAYLAVKHTGTPNLQPPVDDLAHKLQDAWADHHTIA